MYSGESWALGRDDAEEMEVGEDDGTETAFYIRQSKQSSEAFRLWSKVQTSHKRPTFLSPSQYFPTPPQYRPSAEGVDIVHHAASLLIAFPGVLITAQRP